MTYDFLTDELGVDVFTALSINVQGVVSGSGGGYVGAFFAPGSEESVAVCLAVDGPADCRGKTAG